MLALVNFTEHVTACVRPFVYCSTLACASSLRALLRDSRTLVAFTNSTPFRFVTPSIDHIVPRRSLSVRFRRSKVVRTRGVCIAFCPSCLTTNIWIAGNGGERQQNCGKEKENRRRFSRSRRAWRINDGEAYSVIRFTLVYDPESRSVRLFGTIDVQARARVRSKVFFERWSFALWIPPSPPLIAVGPQTQWRKWLKPVHGQTASRRSLKRSRLSP